MPQALRHEILCSAHETHSGMSKMKSVLRAYCFWPRINADIEEFVRHCTACTVYQQRVDKPPMVPVAEQETKPWCSVAVDLTGPSDILDGKVLLTIIDLYSRYPEVYILKDITSSEIVSKLRSTFARCGFPERVISDNGSVFVSQEFRDFLINCGIKPVNSSFYYPQSNSTIERFHGTLKSKLKRLRFENRIPLQMALDNVLFDIRATPNDINGHTPFFRLFGREMYTKLSKLAMKDVRVVGRKRSARNKYAKKQSIVKNYEPGQSVLV